MEKEKNYNETNLTKKYKILFAGFLAIITLILIGTTYAFFTASTDNSHNQTASVTSGTMVLTFSDNDNGVSAVLHLGESVTKTFTIQNTGTLEAYAKITWVDLVNTYISPGLTYELSYSTSQNGTYIPVKTGSVPNASSATTTELSNALLIPADTTYYYKVTITYNNLTDVDQTADKSAKMHSKFNIVSTVGTAIGKIIDIASSNPTTMVYDGTIDNNLRYVGPDPNNYVSFSDGLWRIVGVFNNIDDGTGKLESRLKIVKADSLGKIIWTTSSNTKTEFEIKLLAGPPADGCSTHNNWIDASLNAYLNTTYYDTLTFKSLIENTLWHIGGIPSTHLDNMTIGTAYTYERGNTVYTGRPTTWIGKVALLYPSDYAFSEGRSNDQKFYSIHSSWAFISDDFWTLSPDSASASAVYVCGGHYYYSYESCNSGIEKVYPAVYLKSTVRIASGDGSKTNPYILVE